jgi:hypothetical protein
MRHSWTNRILKINMDTQSSPLRSRRSVKSRPISVSPWKQELFRRCEERVKERREDILDSLRHKTSTTADLMADLVAVEHAKCLDENFAHIGGRSLSTPGRARDLRNFDRVEEEDEDDSDLTEDERLELLLYLQEALCVDVAEGDEAQECLASVHEWERAEIAALVDWADVPDNEDTDVAAVTSECSNPFETPHVSRSRLLDTARSGGSAGRDYPGAGPAPSRNVTGKTHISPAIHGSERICGSSSSSSSVPERLVFGSEAVAVAASMLDDDCPHIPHREPPARVLSHSEVLCPVCRRRCLFTVSTAIGCRCGFRMNTANGLTIEHLHQSLAASYAAHRAGGCTAEPVYRLQDYFGVDAVWMSCEACEDLQVVL